MPTSLHAKFHAYRTAPKAAPEVCGPPAPKLYPHDGFLSNAETRHERALRVGAAMAEGFKLGPLDIAWLLRWNEQGYIVRRKWGKNGEKAANWGTVVSRKTVTGAFSRGH